MGESEAETEEGNERTGEATRRGAVMIGRGTEVEAERGTGVEIETGSMIMNGPENMREVGTE